MGKVQKIEEGALLGNGSKGVIYPVTVGKAVSVKYKNSAKNLNNALKQIEDTKCEWLHSQVEDDGFYHLYGFSSKAMYIAWENETSPEKKDAYVLLHIITGEVNTEPPENTDPILFTPMNYEDDPLKTVYSNNKYIRIRGANLKGAIYMNSLNKNIFMRRDNSEDLPRPTMEILAKLVQTEVCSPTGSVVLLSPGPNFGAQALEKGDIIIQSKANPKEFEDITIKAQVADVAKIVSPDNIELNVSNDSPVTTFRLQGVNIDNNNTVVSVQGSGVYISTKPNDPSNRTVITLTEDQVENGIDIYLTCNKYNGINVYPYPTESSQGSILIFNVDAGVSKTISYKYTYVPPMSLSFVSPTSGEMIINSPEISYTGIVLKCTSVKENLLASAYYQTGGIRQEMIVAYKGQNTDRWRVVEGGVIPASYIAANPTLDIRVNLIEDESLFNVEDLSELQFTNGILFFETQSGNQSVQLRLGYNCSSTFDFVLPAEENPALVENINYYVQSTHGTTVHNEGILEDVADIIEALPESFMQDVNYSTNNVPFNKLHELGVFENLTTIGDCAFMGCTNLESVVIPGTITNFGFGAFAGCTNLHTLTFEEGITSFDIDFIGLATKNSSDQIITVGSVAPITTLDLPSTIESLPYIETLMPIGEVIDAESDDLTNVPKIICRATTPPEFNYKPSSVWPPLGGNMTHTFSCVLYVPEAAIDNYLGTDWRCTILPIEESIE